MARWQKWRQVKKVKNKLKMPFGSFALLYGRPQGKPISFARSTVREVLELYNELSASVITGKTRR